MADGFAVDAAGNPVALQPHQVEDAHEVGFKPISAQYAGDLTKAQDDKNYVDENWGTVGKALAGVGSGLTLGLGPAALAGAGILDRGHLEAAQQSGAYTAGDIAGTLLPAFLSGGEAVGARGVVSNALRLGTPAGLMGEAGGLAERLVGHFAGEAGILGKLGSDSLKMAARGASEGALINLSHTVSDSVIQNKPLAAQAMLASGVDGALFGGLTGGILGGVTSAAGAGIDMVGGRVASSSAAGSLESKAGTALKRLGASEGKLADLAARDGDLVTPLKNYYKILQDGGESLASDTGSIKTAVATAEKKYAAIAADAVEQLQKESPSILNGRLSNMSQRIKQDLIASYQGTAEQGLVQKMYGQIGKDLSGMKTWAQWAKSREQIADRMQQGSGIQKDVYKTVLNAFDGELSDAMNAANPELATAWQAATTGQRQARELLEMTGKKAAMEAAQPSVLHANGADAATFGYSVLAGANPLVGAGIIAGKKIVAHVQRKLEPAVAEAAYRSAIGAEAGHATVNVGRRVSDTLGKFMTGARVTAEKEHAGASTKLSYTMANYQKSMDLADELTSQAHQAKVRELTSALTTAGHAELADEMAQTYGRAVAYIKQNQPKGAHTKEYKMGTLSKPAKATGLTTQGMRFLRQLHTMRDPQDAIMGGLARGDISRDAVATAKYVFPDYMNMVIEKASDKLMEMKQEGKYLAADKVALLGVVLDAPVDSKLTKEYIGEVQKGLAANKAPPPDEASAAPPTTDVSSYQTPLQSSV